MIGNRIYNFGFRPAPWLRFLSMIIVFGPGYAKGHAFLSVKKEPGSTISQQ